MSDDKITKGGLTAHLEQDEDATSPRENDNLFTMVCWHRNYNLGDCGDDRSRIGNRKDANPSKLEAAEFMQSLAEEYHPNLEDYLDNKLFTKMVTVDYAADAAKHNEQEKAFYAKRREIIEGIVEKHYLIAPLYLYDHSGLRIKIGSFQGLLPQGHAEFDSGQVGWIFASHKEIKENWSKKKLTKELIAQAQKLMESEVEEYDRYLSGDCWGYVIETEDGETVDSCWGFIGSEYAEEEMKSALDAQVRYRDADAKAETERFAREEDAARNYMAL